MAKTQLYSLWQLARSYGVQTAYYDATRRRSQASPEALFQILRALGVPIENFQDAPQAFRERREALWQRLLEPAVVAWGGGPAELELHLPEEGASGSVACHLKLETGDSQTWTCELEQLPTQRATEVEGTRYVAKRLVLPESLPGGYHQLTVETPGKIAETMVISAPLKAYSALGGSANRAWGVFLPLYSLHSQRSWGCGDFSDLEALMDWIAEQGGDVVATLPFLASFLDKPFDPSPYAPASRLFWNEFYVDVSRVPELSECPPAQTLLGSGMVQKELEDLRSSPLVDYRRLMILKRRLLEELARYFFSEKPGRYASLLRFMETNPALEDYARFRAAGERQGTPWPAWPQPLRDGILHPGDYDEDTKRYHIFAQWLAHEQLQVLSQRARQKGLKLYLDLPLGVHSDGYDVWRERDAFVRGASAGAPPDAFFSKGQDWGFPPIHPEGMREQGYRYYIAVLRHHLSHAGLLRIDHMMGLHRLFWVPKGLEAKDGVYVRYPAEELYAILCLESQRHQAFIVGEDLGTVPSYVRPTMARHNVHGMYVLPFNLTYDPGKALPVPSARSLVSLNTHDMPTFSAFFQGLDIEDRVKMDLLDEPSASRERESRQALKKALTSFLRAKGWLKDSSEDTYDVLRACLRFLSASPAPVILVNLEDLWLEPHPQNVPGTWEEHANWRRKARFSLEEFPQMPQVVEALHEIDRIRKGR